MIYFYFTYMNKNYILNKDTEMRCDFTKSILVPNKSYGIGSLFTMIPQGTKVIIWNHEKNSYYYQNPYHSNYFKAKVISWGEIKSDNKLYDLINNITNEEAYLTVNIDNFDLELKD